jgi:tetratricopeptide (TPR) repeat protein
MQGPASAEDLPSLLRQAREYRSKQRLHPAFDLLLRALAEFGSGTEVLTEFARVGYASGDYQESVNMAGNALEHDPRSVPALLYLALSSAKLGKNEDALAAYSTLLSIDPSHTVAYTNRGNVYEDLGRPDEAFADFDEAIRRDPADYKARYNRANLLYQKKRYDEAFAEYDRSIAANPIYLLGYGNRGATFLELERYSEAIDDFTEAIRCEPRAIMPLVNRGCARWQSGDRAQGYADLRRAMDLDPFNSWPVITLADFLEKDGRWPEALQYFDKAAGLLNREAEGRANALRARLGVASNIPNILDMFPVQSGNQWLDTIAFWLKRLESRDAGDLWKGLPFPELLAEIREESRGRDAHYLRGLGDAAFSRARTAFRDDNRKRDAIQHLYRAAAYFTLGADLENLGTALGNLAASLADIRHVDEALRVQTFALELKRLTGSPPENISRSHRLIAELEQIRGNYLKARQHYETAAKIQTDAGRKEAARQWDGPISHLDSVIYLVNEFAGAELDPPPQRSCAEWMGEAKSEIDTDPRAATLKLHHAVEAARRAGQRAEQLAARLLLARTLYERFSMFREAYRQFAAAAILASSLGDKNGECEARLSQARVAAESGDFGSSRELLELALSKLSGDPPSRLRAELLFVLSLVCYELELVEQSGTYLEMGLRDARSLPEMPENNWFARQGHMFEMADLPRHAMLIWKQPILGGGTMDGDQLNLIERAAHLHYRRRSWREAILLLEFAVVCAKVLGDAPAQARSWTHLGMAALELEDYATAENAKKQAEALPVKPEDNAAQSDLASLSRQLFAIQMSGELTNLDAWRIAETQRTRPFIARDILRTKAQRALASATPDAIEIGNTFAAMAISSERAGQTGYAFQELFEGLRTLRRLKLWNRRADLLQVYATILMRHRRVRPALRVLRAAVAARIRFDPGRNFGPLLACAGECWLQLPDEGKPANSIEALEVEGEFESEWTSPDGLLILSRLFARWRRPKKAARLAETHLAEAAKVPESPKHARALAWSSAIRLRAKDLAGAEASAQQAWEIWARNHATAPEADRLDWRRAGIAAAETLLGVWYQQPGGRATNAARALALVEGIRLRSLLQRYGRDLISTPEGFPKELADQESYLLALDRNRTEHQPRLDPNQRWKTSFLERSGELEEFWSKLPEPWRAYGQLRLGEPGDPQKIVRDSFGDSQTHVVVLFPTDFGTYRWRLAHDGAILEWKRSALTLPAVQGFATRFVASLAADQDVEDAGSFAKDLFDSAIDRIAAGETICIVPSGPLLQLPFGALPAAGGYLVERNPVAVLPALSLLPYWGKKRGNDTVLVLGDSLGDLEGARKEAERVAAPAQNQAADRRVRRALQRRTRFAVLWPPSCRGPCLLQRTRSRRVGILACRPERVQRARSFRGPCSGSAGCVERLRIRRARRRRGRRAVGNRGKSASERSLQRSFDVVAHSG